MSTEHQWKKDYDTLKKYIADNPDIYIDFREVSIPSELRDQFYIYFDSIRASFIKSCYDSLPFSVDALRDAYSLSEKELTELTGIKKIDLPVDLTSFLHNPEEGMLRWLYNRLFELVQGKITIDDFEELARSDFNAAAGELYRLGYESWAVFSIITALKPDKIIGVVLDDDDKPETGELDEIAFGRQFHHPAKRIPEFIIHSAKLEKYIALKMPLVKEVDGYDMPYEIPKKVLRDRTGDTSFVLDSRVMFLSVIEDLNRIPVYLNMYTRKIENPDLTVEFLTVQDINDTDQFNRVLRRVKIMNPVQGCTAAVINPDTDSDFSSVAGDIDIIPAGLAPEVLQSVLDKLM